MQIEQKINITLDKHDIERACQAYIVGQMPELANQTFEIDYKQGRLNKGPYAVVEVVSERDTNSLDKVSTLASTEPESGLGDSKPSETAVAEVGKAADAPKDKEPEVENEKNSTETTDGDESQDVDGESETEVESEETVPDQDAESKPEVEEEDTPPPATKKRLFSPQQLGK